MTCKEPELFTVLHDFTTLRDFETQVLRMVRVVYRESDLGIRFAIWTLDLTIRDLGFSKHVSSVRTGYEKECHYLIFVIRENEFLYP